MDDGVVDIDVYTALEKRIALLEDVMNQADGYKLVVTHSDGRFSSYDKHIIHMKCVYLRNAYRIALDNMPMKTWQYCCDKAKDAVNSIGYDTTICGRTVANWNMQFRIIGKF